MMTINESGMVFGPFNEKQVYQIEKAEAYTSLGKGVKAVEFIYRKNKDKLFFVEAKKSSPMPSSQDFSAFIEDIAEKFLHSFNLWLTLKLNLRKDSSADKVLAVSVESQAICFVLVINGHEEEWLPPIKAALERKMMAEIKIWHSAIIVLNDKLAERKKLIQR